MLGYHEISQICEDWLKKYKTFLQQLDESSIEAGLSMALLFSVSHSENKNIPDHFEKSLEIALVIDTSSPKKLCAVSKQTLLPRFANVLANLKTQSNAEILNGVPTLVDDARNLLNQIGLETVSYNTAEIVRNYCLALSTRLNKNKMSEKDLRERTDRRLPAELDDLAVMLEFNNPLPTYLYPLPIQLKMVFVDTLYPYTHFSTKAIFVDFIKQYNILLSLADAYDNRKENEISVILQQKTYHTCATIPVDLGVIRFITDLKLRGLILSLMKADLLNESNCDADCLSTINLMLSDENTLQNVRETQSTLSLLEEKSTNPVIPLSHDFSNSSLQQPSLQPLSDISSNSSTSFSFLHENITKISQTAPFSFEGTNKENTPPSDSNMSITPEKKPYFFENSGQNSKPFSTQSSNRFFTQVTNKRRLLPITNFEVKKKLIFT